MSANRGMGSAEARLHEYSTQHARIYDALGIAGTTYAVEQAGFVVNEIAYPIAKDASNWVTDEASVPPFILLNASRE